MKKVVLTVFLALCVVGTANAAPIGYWSEAYLGGGPGQVGNGLEVTNCVIPGAPGCIQTFQGHATLLGISNVEDLGGGVTRYTTSYGDAGLNNTYLNLFAGNPFGLPGYYAEHFVLTVFADIGSAGEYLGGRAVGSMNHGLDAVSFDLALRELGPWSSQTSGLTGHYGDMTAVPEPATLSLLGLGLVGAARLRRRK